MTQRLKIALKRGFIFLLLPGFIVYLISSIISFLDGIWSPVFIYFIGKFPFWGAGTAVSVFLILLIGLILTMKFLQKPAIANALHKLWARIPILNLFFGKEFFSKTDLEKAKSVLIEYPSPGLWQIGFIIGTQKFKNGNEFYKVLVPTTPVPATGFLVMVETDSDKIIMLKNKPLETVKLILSVGFADVELETEKINMKT